MRDLRFIGDWPLLLGLAAAILLAAVAWFYYRRETRQYGSIYAWLLPALRCLAVFLLVVMLTGPVLHHRWIVGQLARILVFIDASRSMGVTDEAMSPGRKILNAVQLGFLSEDVLSQDLLAMQKELEQVRRHSPPEQFSAENIEATAEHLLERIEKAYLHLNRIKLDSSMGTFTKKGTILYEYWNNVRGSDLNSIKRTKGYPQYPSGSIQMKEFRGRVNWKDNYATRISGYVYPPVTGEYTFWVASDDQSWLYLSTDENPANRELIARVSGSVPADRWEQRPEQKSKPIKLQSGIRYYIETLHIEQTGGDHIAVAWQLPDGTKQQPIPGAFLSPYKSGDTEQSNLTSQEAALEQFRTDLLQPARELTKKTILTDTEAFSAKYSEILIKTAFWQKYLQSSFEGWASKLSLSNAEEIDLAIGEIDQMNRLQRVGAFLLTGEEPLLVRLAEDHNIDLIAFSDTGIEPLWHSQAGQADDALEILSQVSLAPDAPATNVGLALKTAIGIGQEQSNPAKKTQTTGKLAVVIFSDGRHNYGDTPVHLSKVCGSREIPVYTVGVGALRKAEDIAIIAVEVPESVYHKDRVKGKIYLKDRITAGKPFVLKVTCEEQTLWEEALQTTGVGRRFIEYDFAVQELLEKKFEGKNRELHYQSFPLTLKAAVVGLEEPDAEPDNDSQIFRTRSIFHKNRILILDGRPRWEYRYVRNLFDRDEKWEVTALLVDPSAPGGGIKRGDGPTMFPSKRELLYNYDLIIIGDFPAEFLKADEMEWMCDAVAKRGIGLVFIDGLRKNLQAYAGTSLAELIPVQWADTEPITNPHSLRLTEKGVLRLTQQGVDMAALVLSSGDKTNTEIWASLKPPHWLASIDPLPAAEVLIEAVLKDSQVPALVFRRFGAGKVLFAAFDETWRWRYRVADEYHQRYWNQMGNLVMAQPFAVSDRFVSLDAGPLVYTPGQTALIRAKIRDTEGNPVTQATANANLFKDGQKVASIPLLLDKESGQFRGQTAALQIGEYEVKINVLGYPQEQMLARAQFYVQAPQAGELAQLDCDQELLKQIAMNSGGEFYREEDTRDLTETLKLLSEGKVMQSDTALWQSYWWFTIVVGLITIEWILRKKAGML